MKQTSPVSNAPSGAGQVRIIGGQWRRSKLAVLSRPGLRPTSDRVRETLFNWLGNDLTGLVCVDVFAGSGALGFEAASRGAKEVLLIEREPELAALLQQNIMRLKAQNICVERGDGLAALRRTSPGSVDLIFLDPPFNSELFLPAISAASSVIRAGGAIYLEAPKIWTDEDLQAMNLKIIKQSKAGAVHFYLLSHLRKSL